MKDKIVLFLEGITTDLFNIAPRLILVVVVLFFGFLIGRLVERLSKRLISYLNRNINTGLQNKSLSVNLDGSSIFISKTLFWIILTTSVLIGIPILQLDFLIPWFERLIAYLPNILAAVIIVFVGIISGRLLGDIILSATSRTGLSNGQQLGRAVRYLVLFVSIVIAIDQLGIRVNFLTTLVTLIIGALLFGASLAFGLGAKTSISNILGAYYVRKSYQLGSTIKLGNTTGVIVKIADHAVTIECEKDLIVIPAKDFNESTVTVIGPKKI